MNAIVPPSQGGNGRTVGKVFATVRVCQAKNRFGRNVLCVQPVVVIKLQFDRGSLRKRQRLYQTIETVLAPDPGEYQGRRSL